MYIYLILNLITTFDVSKITYLNIGVTTRDSREGKNLYLRIKLRYKYKYVANEIYLLVQSLSQLKIS